jgi:hypothetical protein
VYQTHYANEGNIEEDLVMIYVKKPGEPIYTPLHLVPPSLNGLMRAISDKFNVELRNIREIYKRCAKSGGVTVRIDDDMVKHYCDRDLFEIDIQTVIDDPSYCNITLMEMDHAGSSGMQTDTDHHMHHQAVTIHSSIPPQSHTPNGS